MKQSNYELTKRRMQGHFLDFDQNTMIRRFGLQHDAEYLYIRFVGRLYRIDRKTGRVQWSWDDFCHGIDGSFHEAMSIYDLLCCSKEGCRLSGEFGTLRGSIAGGPGGELFSPQAGVFQGRTRELPGLRWCGGGEGGCGVLPASIRLFAGSPVLLGG